VEQTSPVEESAFADVPDVQEEVVDTSPPPAPNGVNNPAQQSSRIEENKGELVVPDNQVIATQD